MSFAPSAGFSTRRHDKTAKAHAQRAGVKIHRGQRQAGNQRDEALLDREGVDVDAVGIIAEAVVGADRAAEQIGQVQDDRTERQHVGRQKDVAVERGQRERGAKRGQAAIGQAHMAAPQIEGGPDEEHRHGRFDIVAPVVNFDLGDGDDRQDQRDERRAVAKAVQAPGRLQPEQDPGRRHIFVEPPFDRQGPQRAVHGGAERIAFEHAGQFVADAVDERRAAPEIIVGDGRGKELRRRQGSHEEPERGHADQQHHHEARENAHETRPDEIENIGARKQAPGDEKAAGEEERVDGGAAEFDEARRALRFEPEQRLAVDEQDNEGGDDADQVEIIVPASRLLQKDHRLKALVAFVARPLRGFAAHGQAAAQNARDRLIRAGRERPRAWEPARRGGGGGHIRP